MSMLAMPIGIAVSAAVLAVHYFVVMTPIGWCLRVLGRDPCGLCAMLDIQAAGGSGSRSETSIAMIASPDN